MPTGISLESKKYTITLEASKTGSGLDWDVTKIPVDFNVGEISGIFDTVAGTGTNYWSAYSGSTFHGNWIVLSAEAATALGDDTNCWVTYDIDSNILAAGVPLAHGSGAIVTVQTILNSVTSTSDYSTPTSYEISSLTTGQTLADAIPFVPPISGVVITQVEVSSDGTNFSIGIYQGDQTTGTTLNLKFMKTGINTVYNSSTEYPDLRIVIDDDSWRLGIVDTGANATPANTQVTVRGYPLI